MNPMNRQADRWTFQADASIIRAKRFGQRSIDYRITCVIRLLIRKAKMRVLGCSEASSTLGEHHSGRIYHRVGISDLITGAPQRGHQCSSIASRRRVTEGASFSKSRRSALLCCAIHCRRACVRRSPCGLDTAALFRQPK